MRGRRLRIPQATRDHAVDLYVQGVPLRDICQSTGVSDQIVFNMLRERGIKPNRRAKPRVQCKVENCERVARGSIQRLCGMHYARAWRHNGDVHHRVKGEHGLGSLGADGYIQMGLKGHPLARASGMVKEHRVVLYDAIGPGPHSCHWCGTPVDWTRGVRRGGLVVDHLDDDRVNNDLANLVPSCNACNVGRAQATRFQRIAAERAVS